MPMQPRPIAETSRPLFPSFRFCIASPDSFRADSTAPCLGKLPALRGDRGCRTHADDFQDHVGVFGAVVMNFVLVVRDETSGRHRLHAVSIVLAARVHPPRSLQHGDESVVGMKVRAAVVMRLPLDQYYVKPG